MTGPYDRWRLPGLYAMVADESDAATVAHLQAWEQQHNLLVTQKQRLESMIAELENHWSPARSEASLAFVDRLKQMVSTIDLASVSAARVWGGLGHVTNALSDAKRDLEQLRAEYDDDAAAAKAFNRRAFPQLPEALVPSQSVIPGLDTLMTHEHQTRLDEQARAIMTSTDQRVAEATQMIGTLPELGRIDEGLRLNPGEVTDTAGESRGAHSYVPAPTFYPPPWAPTGQPIVTDSPILATETPTTMPVAHLEPSQLPVNGGLGGMPPFQASSKSSRLPLETQAQRTGIIGAPSGQFTMPGTSTKPAGTPNALPYPGVIGGGTAHSGGAQVRHRSVRDGAASSRPPRLRDEPSRRAGQSADGGWFDQSFAQYAQRRQGRRQNDPGTTWDTEEGVAPILEAPRLPSTHDPGPGVIGIDR
ncbi:hypothetical protein ABZS66_33605 [Dactylosporangium sp. NPDC005572]|uniref:hypothetical protein n=1 Tax=Dactylosporangium sp. NPDC005572 TaxID=3156889 RepID=UPI0033B08EF6